MSPNYKLCFVLDKKSMFKLRTGYVKPLHIIWSKGASRWNKTNTVHVDDLERNFAMNPESGIVIAPFHRCKEVDVSEPESELIYLAKYLVGIHHVADLSVLRHRDWKAGGGTR